ncbi:MAG: adenylyl-sulfate kinase [Candidatus Muiribacterium halophilum]|uniref:Adenylyl-sulfate kinase n=1 Tax=Muiribacterium halophilum TaxID=2053465 RepID=A0A2N5Z9S1_MUIH1|nr:MAG: adenylyl-sulfate kinase [Candidatus Muirbacterium halophilum]
MKNIIPHEHLIKTKDRSKIKGHKPAILWFTGLSGSGKSTVASYLEKKLNEKKIHTYILDGDNVRSGLNSDLDFTQTSREENIRRISEVSKLFYDSGLINLVCFISPYIKDREKARELIPDDGFIEIFVDCPLEECENRDVKGLYKKARDGEIKHFTGIDAPYESPENPEITINTKENTVEECTDRIISYLKEKQIIPE